MNFSDFGTEIRWRRERDNYTQAEMAAKIGVTQSAYGKYETNAIMPNVSIACKLAKVLGTTCEELCGYGKYVKVKEEQK